MPLIAVLLAALAVALAWPVPVLLARAAWPSRHPGAALLLWQGIALLGGLSMIGSMLLWGLSPFGSTPVDAVRTLMSIGDKGTVITESGVSHLTMLGATALLFAHLIFTLAVTGARMTRRRRRHIEALRLVAHEAEDARGRLVVDSDLPIAYCLPSTGGSITVVTDGIIAALSDEELQAVLAHENAHILQRHDLLVWAFSAWRTALPWLPTSKLALESVAELIEYLADDLACQTHRPRDIARALVSVAATDAPKSLSDALRHPPGSGERAGHRATERAGKTGSHSFPKGQGHDDARANRTLRRALRLAERS